VIKNIPQEKESPTDPWSQWLLHRRHGGDPKLQTVILGLVNRIRDRVLDGTDLQPGMVLVDVGSGDGLIPFGAFERVGPSIQVIFTDISAPLIERAKQLALERELQDRCVFLQTPAEELEGVASESADVLTSRAVLAYVGDKMKALRQFHRVLKPGGRISIGEPINRDAAIHLAAVTNYLKKQPNDASTAPTRLYQRWRSAQLPSTLEEIRNHPLTNYTERDLVNFFRQVGFSEIHLELHIDERKTSIESWDTYLDIAPLPNTPTLREILSSDFSLEEQSLLEGKLRLLFESDLFLERDTVAYLTAVKPSVQAFTKTSQNTEAPKSLS